MKFFEGNLQNAISKRKTFSSAFIVFVESNDEKSERFRRLLNEENTIPVKEYIAFRISPPSDSYKHFLTIYREVPVPSVFIIGSDGQPIRILVTCECRDEFYAEIKRALEIHKNNSIAQRRSERLQNHNVVQLLLKLPKGETAVVEFLESTRLREVKLFVVESLQVKIAFEMITPFPRKVFCADDEEKTLTELQLYPTSTILVVPTEKRKSWTPTFISNIFSTLVYNVGRILRIAKDWLFSFIPRRPI